MNLSMLQTELVACALCEADGKDPDADVPTGEWETVRIGPDALKQRAVTRKAWQGYADEARKLVTAAQVMERFSTTLSMFRSLAQHGDAVPSRPS